MTKLAIALAFLALMHGVRFGTFTASGADSYGYVSEADLWLKGTLIIDQPLHDEFVWRSANWTLTPLAYRPGDIGGSKVADVFPRPPLLVAPVQGGGGEEAFLLGVAFPPAPAL